MFFNGHHEEVGFTVPEAIDGDEWHLLVETSGEPDRVPKICVRGDSVSMANRSLAVYVMERKTADEQKPKKKRKWVQKLRA